MMKMKNRKTKNIIIHVLICLLFLTGCEDTDVQLVAEAGLDALKAITLTDESVQSLSAQASHYSDSRNPVAPPHSKYYKRLHNMV